MMIGFGLLMIASTKYVIPIFSTEHRIRLKRFDNSYLTSLIFGIAFALGWTPCVGPILGSIYTFAATSPGIGFLLLLTYSFGLGIPFLIVGAFVSRFSEFFSKMKRFMKYFSIVSGLFLIVVGAMVVTGYIGVLSIFLLGLNGAVSSPNELNFLLALVAGILTFLSPCILPLVPAYFAYMVGTTAEKVRK